MKMTPKQQRFVDEYLIDLNATQAAIRAGYSKNRAKEIGYQLLRKTTLAEAIKNRQEKREARTEITQDRVLQELARIAFLDPRKLYDSNGGMLDVNQLDENTAAAVMCKGRPLDKNQALTLIMRHLGMLNDKMKITHAVEDLSDEELDQEISQLESGNG